jgi:hypothetical protein
MVAVVVAVTSVAMMTTTCSSEVIMNKQTE